MPNIVYSKYYAINTLENKMDVYDDLTQLELFKPIETSEKLVLDNGVKLIADESQLSDFHYWGGPSGSYDIYFEVYLVELPEGDFDSEFDDPIEDDLFVKEQKRIGFIKSGTKLEFND